MITEMNAKLLQKIEELMLYTIAQQREIQHLQEAADDLGKWSGTMSRPHGGGTLLLDTDKELNPLKLER